MSTPTMRELLEKVTPGGWRHRRLNEDDPGFVEARVPGKPYGQEILGDDYFSHLDRASDAAYIARLSPDTIKAVLEALEPFAHPDLAKSLGGNIEKDESPVFGRDKALLRIKHFKAVRAALHLLNGTTQL